MSDMLPSMPIATAVWLIKNTSLHFEQIAQFCGMHLIRIQGIADGEVAAHILGQDPIHAGQLTREEITRCEADENRALMLSHEAQEYASQRRKKASKKYTPLARRQDKPNAIAWILKNHPTVPDNIIIKLIGTTKSTIKALRERTHWNMTNIHPRDPVLSNLCSQTELDTALLPYMKIVEATEEEEVSPIISNPFFNN